MVTISSGVSFLEEHREMVTLTHLSFRFAYTLSRKLSIVYNNSEVRSVMNDSF
jgi:hypothetical protein